MVKGQVTIVIVYGTNVNKVKTLGALLETNGVSSYIKDDGSINHGIHSQPCIGNVSNICERKVVGKGLVVVVDSEWK